ncbi:recombination-associated protein RdgC [Spongiibacter sp. KMU-158]|uniref:Recombination-associated protein RdgC n=1 Tax=Spongiibacter pelagi TaxID=2760804 RepID=A0A927C1E7_9GAMM|nr:recombination-associated protein RdgC [Spongiibacter pelagi]MBD2859499.1 recombination-associated protein RdgC [Spongiibacter pelagi]
MWFRNLLIYRFTRPFSLSPEELNEQLAVKAFVSCGSQDMASIGWVSPLGKQDGELIHTSNGCIMLCCQRQEKVLPAAAVKDVLEERVQDIREGEDRAVGRKERMQMKEDIIFEMLPRAFSKSRKQFAYIDPANGWLIFDTASHKRAEEIMVLLRECIGSLPVIPLAAKNTTQHCMTSWLKTHAPTSFELGGECELIDGADESAAIKCKNQNLSSPEILNHIDGGMFVKKLSLSWTGGIDFTIDEQLTVRGLRFADLITDKTEDSQAETAAEKFDVDFAILNAELAQFIPALLSAFGGEELGTEEEVAV